MKQPHLKVSSINKFVILPGDPGRIDKFATEVTDFEEVSFNREFRIVNARYKGIPISLVSTGIGCPSAAIAIEELATVGVQHVIRIGTCGGLLKEMGVGNIVIPSSAVCLDGTTKEYKSNIKIVDANAEITSALEKASNQFKIKYFKGINRTHDAFYEPIKNFISLEGKGYISSEMECSAVFLVSKFRGVKAGAILVVNTSEPPELVRKNPDAIYNLFDEKRVEKGMKTAIKIALQAIHNTYLSQ